jgi:hypothetical protein
MSGGTVSLHDWLIDELAATNAFSAFAAKGGFKVAKNPTGQQNLSVTLGNDKMWPDVFVYDSKTRDVKRIGEIETEETVTIEHAKGHWDSYGKAAAGDFVVVVPNGSVIAAKEIMTRLQVVGQLWEYKLVQDNSGKTSVTSSIVQ